MRTNNCILIGALVVMGAVSAPEVQASPVCGLGACIDPHVPRGSGWQPSERATTNDRDDDDSSGEPTWGPPPPGNRKIQRERAAAERYQQGQRAARRRRFDEAIGHFEAAVAGGARGAAVALADVQHTRAVQLFNAREYVAARRLVESAMRNDPSNELYPRKRKLMNDIWCEKNQPLIPHEHRPERDDFDEKAWLMFREKAGRAMQDGWECGWFYAGTDF